MTGNRSRFISNSVALMVTMIATAVLTLVQVKLLATHLEQSEFGLFAALRGLSLLLSIVAANGLPQLLVRYLPAHEATTARTRAMVLSVSCLVVTSLILIAIAVLARVYPGVLFRNIPAVTLTPAFQGWFILTTVAVALKLVLYGGLNGLRRMSAQTVLEVVSLTIQVVWIFSARDTLTVESLFRIIAITSIATVAVGAPWFLALVFRATTPSPEPHDNAPRPSYGGYWMGQRG